MSGRNAWTDAQRITAIREMGPWKDTIGNMVLALCDWSQAVVHGRPTTGKDSCGTGSQCACVHEDEQSPLTGPFRLATGSEADNYWHNIAAGIEDPRV